MSENRPARRWPIIVVRSLGMLVLIQVVTQAALAGAFISGAIELLRLHSFNAILLLLTSLALIPFTIFIVRRDRGPRWPILLSAALWVAVVIQGILGLLRLVGLHIPMGMALMGLTTGFAWWAFSYRSGDQRPATDSTRPATDSTLTEVTATAGQQA